MIIHSQFISRTYYLLFSNNNNNNSGRNKEKETWSHLLKKCDFRKRRGFRTIRRETGTQQRDLDPLL